MGGAVSCGRLGVSRPRGRCAAATAAPPPTRALHRPSGSGRRQRRARAQRQRQRQQRQRPASGAVGAHGARRAGGAGRPVAGRAVSGAGPARVAAVIARMAVCMARMRAHMRAPGAARRPPRVRPSRHAAVTRLNTPSDGPSPRPPRSEALVARAVGERCGLSDADLAARLQVAARDGRGGAGYGPRPAACRATLQLPPMAAVGLPPPAPPAAILAEGRRPGPARRPYRPPPPARARPPRRRCPTCCQPWRTACCC